MNNSRGLAGKASTIIKKGLIDHSNQIKVNFISNNNNNIYFKENIIVSPKMYFTAMKMTNDDGSNKINLKDLQEISNLSHVLTDRLGKLVENVSNNPELNQALAFEACYNSNITASQRQEMIDDLTFVKNATEKFIRKNTNCVNLDNQQQIVLERSTFLHKSLCYYLAADSHQGLQLINYCLPPDMYVGLFGHIKEYLNIYPGNHPMNSHMAFIQGETVASFTTKLYLNYYGILGKNVEIFQKNKDIYTNDQYLGYITYQLENAIDVKGAHIKAIKALDSVKNDVNDFDRLNEMSKCNRVVNNTVNHVIYNGVDSLKKVDLKSANFKQSINSNKNTLKKWSDYHYDNKKNLSVITESDISID